MCMPVFPLIPPGSDTPQHLRRPSFVTGVLLFQG